MENALEIHAYYSKIFEAFAILPAADISGALFERACYLWAERPWYEFGCFLERVEAYANAAHLTPSRKEAVAKFLLKQKLHFQRCCWLVEERPREIDADKDDLNRRLKDTLARRIYPAWEALDRTDAEASAAHFERVRTEVNRRLAVLSMNACLSEPLADDLTVKPLTLRQVALMHVYRRAHLTPALAAEVARQAGYSSPSSGRKLMQHYNALDRPADRINVVGGALREMQKAIEGVIPYLTDGARQQAQSERQTLEAKR